MVIGSSAGGIEALSLMVSALPADFPAPIIVAQHSDPRKPSHLGEILSRRTQMKVRTVEAEEHLEPGVIYLVPSNHHVELTDHAVKPIKDGNSRPVPSVNHIFISAASIFKENLIAVILTGMGSDGAVGAKEVHLNGGTVISQNPDTASFPSMPNSLDPLSVDMVLELDRIVPILQKLVSGSNVWPATPQAELSKLLSEIQNRSGIDFSQYKSATIHRRLERRIASTETGTLSNYLKFLEQNPDEYQKLINAFLIKVTEFMRDPSLFDYLKSDVFPKLIDFARKNRNTLRVWSAGCATGEEPYTLAILFLELLDTNANISLRIFATDLDAKAVAFARRGTYLPRALQHIRPELIEKYFDRTGELYQVKKRLRELIIFGEHDLAQRAPFPNLDLILCRNVMIYFSSDLQRRALQLFAYSLRLEGYLVVGKAETTSPLPTYFSCSHNAHKVFVRSGDVMAPPPLGLSHTQVGPKTPYFSGASKTKEQFGNIHFDLTQARSSMDSLMKSLPIGVVLVDSHYHIIEINSSARKLMRIFSPALGEDLIHATEIFPGRDLRNGIDAAFKNAAPCVLSEIKLPDSASEKETWLNVTCHPHEKNTVSTRVESVLLLVHDVTALVLQREQMRKVQESQVSQVQELSALVNQLRKQNAAQTTTINTLSLENSAGSSAGTEQEAATLRQKYAELQSIHSLANVHAQELEQKVAESSDQQRRAEDAIEHLKLLNQDVISGNEQLMRVNEDLRSANEGLMLTAEEAEATREEAETLTEEVQAGNEELETLNEELQASVEELNTTNSDLSARTIDLETMSRAAEQERTKLALVLQSLEECLIVVDRSGRMILSNQGYTDTFGDTPILQDEQGESLPVDRTPLAHAMKGEAYQCFVTLPTTPRRYFEAIVSPVRDNSDKSLFAIITYRDVTHRILVEKENRRLERHARSESEQANRVKDEFLAVLSHELRTPLTSMFSWVKILKQKPADQPLLSKGLEVIERNIQAQTRLTEDLLDISRIVAGKLSVEKKPLDFSSIVAQNVEMQKPVAAEKKVHLEGDSETSGIMVVGDEIRLRQAVWNIISNAIKFTPEHGRIRVSIETVGTHVTLSVTDSGQGIRTEFLPHIFKLFTQEDVGFSRRYMGLGLGLTIARTIVELHGGSIAALSDGEGKGSTFKISLPLLDEPLAASGLSPVNSNISFLDERILVVEDDADVRNMLSLLFRNLGASVETVVDRTAAIAIAKTLKPTILVSDIGLPGGDGYELIQELRADEKSRGEGPIPAIAISGYVQPEDQDRSRKAGFNLHIKKPFDPNVLVSQIHSLLIRIRKV